MNIKERYDRFKKEVAYLFERLEEDLGLAHDPNAENVVTTDSGGGTTSPPTVPGGGH